MAIFYFKRVTENFFHVIADSKEEALKQLREEPGRYQEGFEEVEWYWHSSYDGPWQKLMTREKP